MANYKADVLNLAVGEVGYREKKTADNLDSKTENAGSGNYTKYWRDLCPTGQTGAWCQCFIDWLFWKTYGEKEAKKLLGMVGEDWTYYTPTAVLYAKRNTLYHEGVEGIQEGDILYFYGYVASEKRSRVHHVGIVYKVTAERIYTVEGNSGNGVNFRTYLKNDPDLYGYIRPAYDAPPDPEELVGWHHTAPGGWWYRYKKGRGAGTFYQNGFYFINGAWYAFDREGYLIYDIGKLAIDDKVGAIYVR